MRVLAIDDDPALHKAYRLALMPQESAQAKDAMDALARELFGGKDAVADNEAAIALSLASQGMEGVAQVELAQKNGEPFQVVFIDIRMPPGIDGKETARRIRAIDPNVNIVIVTAYSDHSATDIARVAGPPDKIFYVTKPFAAEEIRQMAIALSERWTADARLKLAMEELAASEARAVYAARHDFLTGAPNRAAFERAMTDRLQPGGRSFAVALFDLDRFKHINDTFGHGAGDELLTAIYRSVRAVLPENAVVARLGGDEFAAIFDADDAEPARIVASTILECCSRKYSVMGHRVEISASVGFLLSGKHPGRNAEELTRYADLALFEAKRKGKSKICMFETTMDESARFRHIVESSLKCAIEKDELSLVYQPIVEREELSVVGFEALLRWTSTEHGPISPSVFIPIAEESGIIHEIGEWVIKQAIEDCRKWPDLYVSINLSARQFQRLDLVQMMRRHADAGGIDYSHIQIEITESTIFVNPQLAAATLLELQSIGFRIAIDDFGTGYSNLTNIKDFALDCIKIDKSFVDDIGDGKKTTVIVMAVTQLARNLGLSVVAEGVESESQCQALRLVGCSHLQGYFFGEPREANSVTLVPSVRAHETLPTAPNLPSVSVVTQQKRR